MGFSGEERYVTPESLVYGLQSERAHREGYDDGIWNDELKTELVRMADATLVRLAEAGCFYVTRDQYGNGDFGWLPAGWRLSDKLYG